MKISEKLAAEIWIPILVRLRRERSVYDFRSAFEVSGGIRRGYSANDMLEELQHVVRSLETEGWVKILNNESGDGRYFGISFPNILFNFTDEFDRQVHSAEATKAKKIEKKLKWENWKNWLLPLTTGLVGSTIAGILVWLIIEKLIK